MAKNANDKAAKDQATEATETTKAKRRALTPEERIAKLEAELKATREKAEAKNRKAIDALLDKRSNLVAKIQELSTKVEQIDEDLRAAGHTGDKVEAEATFTSVELETV